MSGGGGGGNRGGGGTNPKPIHIDITAPSTLTVQPGVATHFAVDAPDSDVSPNALADESVSLTDTNGIFHVNTGGVDGNGTNSINIVGPTNTVAAILATLTVEESIPNSTDKITIEATDTYGSSGYAYVHEDTACYCAGTLIRTIGGDVAVEELAIADRVVTVSGEAKPIRWIGRRSYAGRFVKGDRRILPVCIKAGALGDGLPNRDLQVSPLHALYIDGVLVAARDLVNGVSVVQAEAANEVHYLHIELDAHEVIFAEGAPAESFRDGELRGMFQNAAEHAALYPEGKAEMAAFAPLVNGGEALQAIRAKIDARAGLKVDAGPLKGFVGAIDGGRIAGWACNPEQPQLPVRLDICVDGRLVAQTLANRYRGDLDEAGIGTGRHGFEITLDQPLPADPRRITVRRSADAKPLPCSHVLRAKTLRNKDAAAA